MTLGNVICSIGTVSIVVFTGFYSGLFGSVRADPEEERNAELVTTEEEEDEEQCEGGKQQDGKFPDPG